MRVAVHHVTGNTWRDGLRPERHRSWVSGFPVTATAQPGSDRASEESLEALLCVRAWLPGA